MGTFFKIHKMGGIIKCKYGYFKLFFAAILKDFDTFCPKS